MEKQFTTVKEIQTLPMGDDKKGSQLWIMTEHNKVGKLTQLIRDIENVHLFFDCFSSFILSFYTKFVCNIFQIYWKEWYVWEATREAEETVCWFC